MYTSEIRNELLPLIDNDKFKKDKTFLRDRRTTIIKTIDIQISNSYNWHTWNTFLSFDKNQTNEALFYIVGFDRIVTNPAEGHDYEVIHGFLLDYSTTLLIDVKTSQYLHELFPEFITLEDNRKLVAPAIISLINKMDICPINKIIELPERIVKIMEYYNYFNINIFISF